MAVASWLARLTNWITYHIGQGEPLEEIESEFEQQFGGMSQEQFDAGIEAALTAAEVDQRLAVLPLDAPMSDALEDIAPPAAEVLVRANIEFACSDGVLRYREVTFYTPWDTAMGDVYNSLVDEAFDLIGESVSVECTVNHVEIREPTFFPM